MITVPETVQKIIKQSPFLEEGLEKGIMNLSELARLLQPQVEKELFKNVSEASIMMALKRMSGVHTKKRIHKVFSTVPDMIVRSHLIEITVQNSATLPQKQKKLLEDTLGFSNTFFTITTGLFETTIIASEDLEQKIQTVLKGEKIITVFRKLSAITVRLTKEVVNIPGVYYHILKILAWDNINIFEVVSAYTEFTIILEEKDVDRAFSTLKNSLPTIKY